MQTLRITLIKTWTKHSKTSPRYREPVLPSSIIDNKVRENKHKTSKNKIWTVLLDVNRGIRLRYSAELIQDKSGWSLGATALM